MAVLPIDEILDALPDLRAAYDRRAVSDDALIAALRATGAEILEFPDQSQAIPPSRKIVVPFTRLHVRLTGASFAILEFAWSLAKISIALSAGGPPDPGDALSLATAAADICRASNRLDPASGEYCIYLAIGRSKSRQPPSRDYPTSEQITQTLQTTGTDWCGMQCRFHAVGHPPFAAADVRAVLERLRDKGDGVVVHHPPDSWWTTF